MTVSYTHLDVYKRQGKQILEWCKAGVTLTTVKDLIQKAVSLQDLTEVYKPVSYTHLDVYKRQQ